MTSPAFAIPVNIPVGGVIQWFTASDPYGWLAIEGQTGLSRTTYAALFAVWGPSGSNILGPGDGVTTFDMPNARGHIIVGQAAAGVFSAAIGSSVGALTDTIGGHANHAALSDHAVHNHGVGTLAGAAEAAHTHGVGTYANAAELSHTHGVGTYDAAAESSHTHTGPSHSHVSGAIAAGGGHTHASGGTHDHADHNLTANRAPGSSNTPSSVSHNTVGGHTHDTIADHTHGVADTASAGTGATGAGSSHDHALSGSSGAGSSHNHAISGSSAAGSSHSHALSGSTANNAAAQSHSAIDAHSAHDAIDIVQPSFIGRHIVYTGV